MEKGVMKNKGRSKKRWLYVVQVDLTKAGMKNMEDEANVRGRQKDRRIALI